MENTSRIAYSFLKGVRSIWQFTFYATNHKLCFCCALHAQRSTHNIYINNVHGGTVWLSASVQPVIYLLSTLFCLEWNQNFIIVFSFSNKLNSSTKTFCSFVPTYVRMWTAEERRRVKKARERAVAHQSRKRAARLFDISAWPDCWVFTKQFFVIKLYQK